MDDRFRIRFNGITQSISSGTIGLFKRTKNLSRAISTSFFITSALILGYLAEQNSAGIASRKFLESHYPSPTLIDSLMRERGLTKQSDKSALYSINRTLPARAESLIQSPAFWISEAFSIAVLGGDPQVFGEMPFLYLPTSPLASPLKNQKWTRLGIGWEGLDLVLLALKNRPQEVQSGSSSPQKRLKKPSYEDPRLIKY